MSSPANRTTESAPRILPSHISVMQKDLDQLVDSINRLGSLAQRAIGGQPPSDPRPGGKLTGADCPMNVPEQLHALHDSLMHNIQEMNNLLSHLEQLV